MVAYFGFRPKILQLCTSSRTPYMAIENDF